MASRTTLRAVRAAGAPVARSAVARSAAAVLAAAPAPARAASSYRGGGGGGDGGGYSRGRQFFGMYFARASGCINMRVVHPQFKGHENGGLHLARPGAVSLELAPALDAEPGPGAGGRFDWANKVTYRLSAGDIAYLASLPPAADAQLTQTIATAQGGPPSTRTLHIALDKARGAGVYGVTVTLGGGGGEGGAAPGRSVRVLLSAVDLALLKHLLNTSLSTITGWAVNLDPGLFDPALHLARDAGGGNGGGYGGGAGGDA